MVHFEGTLYVVGGIHYPYPLNALVIESYNFKRDTWKLNTTIPISLNRFNFTLNFDIKACALGVNRELLTKPIVRPLEVKVVSGVSFTDIIE